MIKPGAPFGPYATLELGNDRLGLTVCPALGGRVLSLVDRWTGREWLVQGEPPDMGQDGSAAAWTRRDALFSGAVAFGWDECLPTVARLSGSGRLGRPPASRSR